MATSRDGLVIRNQYRTFRVFELKDQEGAITFNMEGENGYDEWKITSDIVDIWNDNDYWYFKTINGSVYRCWRYVPDASMTTIVDQYMKINGFVSKRCLSLQEFYDLVMTMC